MSLIQDFAQLYHDTPVVDAQHPASANNQFTIGDLHGKKNVNQAIAAYHFDL